VSPNQQSKSANGVDWFGPAAGFSSFLRLPPNQRNGPKHGSCLTVGRRPNGSCCASLFFFSRSNGQLEPPPPIAPFTLHLAITSRTVDTWNMFLCFTLHVAFTLFFLPEQNIAGEQVRRQGVRWSILFCLTGQIALFHLLEQICVVQEKDCRNPESWSATPFLSSVSKWLQIGLGMPGAREMRLLIVT